MITSDTESYLPLTEITLDQTMSAMNDAVVVVDRDGIIVFVNPAYSRIMNVPAHQALGRNMSDVTPNAHTLKVLRTGKPLLCDSHYSEKLGFDVVMSVSPIFKQGQLLGAVTVFRSSQELFDLYSAYRRTHGLADYYRDLLQRDTESPSTFDSIVGRSRALCNAIALAARVAKTDATVLITGENGVGKDIFAQAIHNTSRRLDKPFIIINCAAIPESLLESELFGYEAGSFTGATREGRLGKFELANGGTIFLDEIGDMSQPMQAKLLRVLQNQEIQRIGSSRIIRVDTRVIAATNRDLDKMVHEGSFREDLLYRLNVFPITVPPLRERREDVPLLVQSFLEHFSAVYEKSLVLAPDALDGFDDYHWPGNVRQLRNIVERAAILCDKGAVLAEHLMPSDIATDCTKQPIPHKGLKGEVLKVERKAYEEALAACGGNKSRAMEMLGVSRRTFYKRLSDFGMR